MLEAAQAPTSSIDSAKRVVWRLRFSCSFCTMVVVMTVWGTSVKLGYTLFTMEPWTDARMEAVA